MFKAFFGLTDNAFLACPAPKTNRFGAWFPLRSKFIVWAVWL